VSTIVKRTHDVVRQDDPTPLEWIFYFGFWILAGIIFAVKLRRGTLIHAESRKQRMEREAAASTTPLLCAQVPLLHTGLGYDSDLESVVASG
jgi:hypothetical protein